MTLRQEEPHGSSDGPDSASVDWEGENPCIFLGGSLTLATSYRPSLSTN